MDSLFRTRVVNAHDKRIAKSISASAQKFFDVLNPL